ncbi:hypothetical protein [Cupriavidus sp. D39]|uniref:hypothetical protein n=1 Tax=Cupriavidus sp. D39 TaxID=2997877 RepID=UPI00226FB743|nr:hypothetical protein [Cupriavidus sp. D39]MCY0855552.1 hypothetical protein [Cupriavidus sp. D39]
MRAQCCRLVLAAAGCALGLALNVAQCFAQAGGGAQTPFVQIGLARQVAIQVPKDWTILSGAQGRAHGTIADAVGASPSSRRRRAKPSISFMPYPMCRIRARP